MKSKIILPFLLVSLSILNLNGWVLYYLARKNLNPKLEIVTITIALLFSIVIFAGLIFMMYKEHREAKAKLRYMEERMEAKEKLAALGELSREMAHEIRTPLGAIEGFSELICRKISGNNECEELLKFIVQEVRNCNGIMSSFLDLTNPLPRELSDIDINQLLDRSLEIVKMRMCDNSIKVVRSYEKLPDLKGNLEHLKQAFSNIITNAFQAMPGGGVLTIKTHSDTGGETLNSQAPSLKEALEKSDNIRGEVRVVFSDTGCGIPKEDIGRIWTSFFTTKEDGIGLGLCIVDRVIKTHGGRIEVDSVINKGTTFTLTLPLPLREREG